MAHVRTWNALVEASDAPDSERARVHEGPQVHVQAGPPQALSVWGDVLTGLQQAVCQLTSLQRLSASCPPEEVPGAQQTPLD